MIERSHFKKISPYLWELPASYRDDMRVPARLFASQSMLDAMEQERSVEQLIHVATLPGIERYALGMPDMHQGYGFPVGGVAAIRASDGIISPGGIGYDINCGVRLLRSSVQAKTALDHMRAVAFAIHERVPSGVGRGGTLKLNDDDMKTVLNTGVQWAIERGYGFADDLDYIEERGCYAGADATLVSAKAKARGRDQLGTIGAGNHFLEIQEVVDIYDNQAAAAYGLFAGQLTVMIHTGSRGLGHQTCTDYVRLMNTVMKKYNITLPDRELACAPFSSDEGTRYFKAMAAAANFAWANRHIIMHRIREAWKSVMAGAGELDLVYDVAHNIAKREVHGGIEYVVHRKGATRAFGPQSSEIPARYQDVGQPVLIPGSMGTYSYVLAGTAEAMKKTFGSCCHGAGRQMSRMRAKRELHYEQLIKALERQGIVVLAGSHAEVVEEAPAAYKNIDEVIEVVHGSGIARKVAKMRPLAVIKG